MALGRVYCFGPTFRAEKSKTRRHLTEFWMIEPEVAFMELPGLLELAEEFVSYIVARVLDRCGPPAGASSSATSSKLEAIRAPFPRMTYDEAAEILTSPEAQATHGGGRRAGCSTRAAISAASTRRCSPRSPTGR